MAAFGGNMMNGFGRSLAWIAAALTTLCFGIATSQAQTGYPDRAVKIIVPIGPGGSYDLVGRMLADVLSKRTGQSFFVENKPGAGTVVGTQAAAPERSRWLYAGGRRALQHGVQFGAVFEAGV